MRKLTILQVVCTAMMVLLCTSVASAFDVSHYATQSKLAAGKWVKISIAEWDSIIPNRCACMDVAVTASVRS